MAQNGSSTAQRTHPVTCLVASLVSPDRLGECMSQHQRKSRELLLLVCVLQHCEHYMRKRFLQSSTLSTPALNSLCLPVFPWPSSSPIVLYLYLYARTDSTTRKTEELLLLTHRTIAERGTQTVTMQLPYGYLIHVIVTPPLTN